MTKIKLNSVDRISDFPKEDGTIEKISIANDFVTPSGGGYFFAPTIEAVREVLGV